MAFTYLALNLVMLAWAVMLFVRTSRRPSRAGLITLFGMLLLTLVFDNIAIWLGFFTYAPEIILGIRIGIAPVEDFFYPLVAALIVPSLWHRFNKTEQHSTQRGSS